MNHPPVESFTANGYTVNILLDDEPSDHNNPRDADMHVGVMLANGHRRYTLGDEPFKAHTPGYTEAEAIVAEMLEEGPVDWAALKARLADELGTTVMLPLYLLDHSGLSMRTGAFVEDPGGWDSGVVGVIFDTEKSRAVTGVEDVEAVTTALQGEVAEYDLYLTGQVYGYAVLNADGEHVDSVWGYLGVDESGIREDARAAAEAQPAQAWIVLAGTVGSGFGAQGPYPTREAAENAANGNTVMLLNPPKEG